MKLKDVDLRWLERYKAPAVLLMVLACVAAVLLRDTVGVSAASYIHIFYLPAIFAALLYGRRALPLAAGLALAEMYLNYQNMGDVTVLTVFDGAAMVVVAAVIGLLSENASRLNARLKDSDRLLQSSEARYLAIFNSASDAIVLFDPATARLVDANEAWVQLSGYSVEESMTINTVRLSTHENAFDDREPMQYVAKALKGNAQLFQWKIRRKDGRDIWVEVNLKRITLAGGDRLIAMIRDIGERKLAEEKLRESEVKYRNIVEQVNDWVWEIDDQGRYTYASPRVLDLLGYEPDEVIGKTPFDFMPAGEAEKIGAAIGPILETHREFNLLQNELVKMDGSRVIVETSGSPMYDGEGGFLGYRGTDRDITERRRAEDARREIDARFRVLTEMTASAILILQDGHIKYANPACEKIAGYTLEEMRAMSRVEAASVIDPASVLKLNLVQFLRKRSTDYHRYEIKLRAKDGRKKWVDVTTGVIDYNGRPAYLATGFDITERKLAEQKLQASLQEKELLLKEVHHRVKNNLQVVSSMLSLQSQNATDPATMQMLQESQDRVRSMALIHERLYKSGDLARINFEDYVRNLTGYLLRSYSRQGQRIGLCLEVSNIPLTIDVAIPCGLIINELVSNSLKYAFPDGRPGTITVSIRQEAGRYTLFVGDDGVGMPAHVDYRNHSSLGLQLVNTLVGQLEGDIALDAQHGTAFTIRFPAQ